MFSQHEKTAPSDIVLQIQNGDKTSEQSLVEKYWKGLFFVRNGQCKDQELAKDITQETFIVVIQKIRDNKLSSPDALASFIRQTGINILIAHFRKQSRQKTDLYDSSELEFPSADNGLCDSLNEKTLLDLVVRVMEEMTTDRDKEILKGYFIDCKSKTELCEYLTLSPTHFDRVLFRARSRLKKHIHNELNLASDKATVTQLLGVLVIFVFSSEGQVSVFFEKNVRESISADHYRSTSLLLSNLNTINSRFAHKDMTGSSAGEGRNGQE